MSRYTNLPSELKKIIDEYMIWFRCICGILQPFPESHSFCASYCTQCNMHGSHAYICRLAPNACNCCGRHDGSHAYICRLAPN